MNEFVRHVKVVILVNDSAERAVKLIHDFSFRTKDEGQKKFLLQVVAKRRWRDYPNFTKATLISKICKLLTTQLPLKFNKSWAKIVHFPKIHCIRELSRSAGHSSRR